MSARSILMYLLLAAVSPAAFAQSAMPSSPPAPETAPIPAAMPAVASERPSSSNKWRIKFDESSKSDGVITFRLWPGEGEPMDVTVAVRNHQAENSIARATRDALRTRLGKGYQVEVDDGEDVLVKAKGGTRHFGLQVLSSSAKDVDVSLDKE